MECPGAQHVCQVWTDLAHPRGRNRARRLRRHRLWRGLLLLLLLLRLLLLWRLLLLHTCHTTDVEHGPLRHA